MVEVLKTGFYDTIQDLGRFGVQQYGIPYSGAMDLYAAKVANTILGNSELDAVLEITIIGPELKFHCSTEIALSGADLSAKLNGKSIKLNTCVQIVENDILSFGARNYGCRCYLAVKYGFQTEFILNSYSMYQTVTQNYRLKKGDQLSIREYKLKKDHPTASLRVHSKYINTYELEALKGPEFSSLSKFTKNALFSTEFTISKDSNRMAYQVNETLENKIQPIMSSLVLPGTIQLTPSGQLLILMRDCQTTGGYPRILQISEASINTLSQKIFSEKFRLKCMD